MAGSKRGQGEGSWRKKAGGWEYRFSVINPTTGMKVQRSVSAKTKGEALQRAEDVTRDAQAGRKSVTVRRNSLTVKQWIDQWVTDYLPHRPHTAATTRGLYRSLLRNHVAETAMGEMRLRQLNALTMEQHVNSVDRALSSRRNLFAALVACMGDAQRVGQVDVSPMTGAKRPSRSGAPVDADVRALSRAEVQQLMEIADGPMLVAVDLFRSLGLRKGELIALMWEDIDLDKMVVHVRRQLTNDREIRPPKSVAGGRVIPLPKHLAGVLLDHRDVEQKRLHDVPDPQPEYVVLNTHGRRYDTRDFSKHYSRLARKAKCHDLGTHALRHHYASVLILDGVNILKVSKWLGHSSTDVTLRVYARVIAEYEAMNQDEVTASFSA